MKSYKVKFSQTAMFREKVIQAHEMEISGTGDLLFYRQEDKSPLSTRMVYAYKADIWLKAEVVSDQEEVNE